MDSDYATDMSVEAAAAAAGLESLVGGSEYSIHFLVSLHSRHAFYHNNIILVCALIPYLFTTKQ